MMPRKCGRQIDFKSLEDNGSSVLNVPDFLLIPRRQQLFRFAEDHGSHVGSGRMYDARLSRGKHHGHIGVTYFNKVSVLGLVG